MSPLVPSSLAARARAWIAGDPDHATRAELEALLDAGAVAELEDRVAGPLRFGTAGLRGALGAGPNRMNVAVVRRATAGFARWLLDGGHEGAPVPVGFDARHGSRRFATEAAGVLAAAGLRPRLADRPWPTPVTAFAVRHLAAAGGIMVTASHNPAADSGYKVYDATGAQIVPPEDVEIAAAIDAAPPAVDVPGAPEAIGPGMGEEVLAAYVAMAQGCSRAPGARDVRVVYTPVHGVGGEVFRRLWRAAGFPDAHEVEAQAAPDPDFPTAPFPNPEEPGVLDLALAEAARVGADLVLANDPDADRLAVAVPDHDGRWRVLSGDELGVLLGDWLVGEEPAPGSVVARSRVSSTWLDAVVADRDVVVVATPTGFKWIARAVDGMPARRLVFGYEEALGYAVGTEVRDKDGLTAALVAAEIAAVSRAAGSSVLERLDALARRTGPHRTRTWSVRDDAPQGAERIVATVAALRSSPPSAIAGEPVQEVVDHAAVPVRQHVLGFGEREVTTDLVELRLADARVMVRPSGTEPKLKCYFEVRGPAGPDLARATAAADARIERLQAGLARSLGLA